jgi:hypothetical protein
VWIGDCNHNLAFCAVDQVGNDESSREFVSFTANGREEWRRPVAYADVARGPEFLGTAADTLVIVPTLKFIPGAEVLTTSGTVVGTYPGRVTGFDAHRAILVEGPTGNGVVTVTLTGLDLDTRISQKPGTHNIRRSGCTSNSTSIMCPGRSDFVLWRVTR